MNKKDVILKLKEKLNLDIDTCNKINDIVEKNFIIGRNNKEKMLNGFINELNIGKDEADKIYNTVMDVLMHGLKEKVMHPFKDLDK